MSRKPAHFTQADFARAIRAAKQAGAAEVEVRVGDPSTIVFRITPTMRHVQRTMERPLRL
jgi:hypothetical protein